MDKLKLNLDQLTVDVFQTSDAELLVQGTVHGQFVPTKPIVDCSADSCGHICP
ncbi:MAG: hypothetical protein JWM27_258 [Gemmatimonadetes bacterium]|nr:hypothetical protein [Gemmatimonadota bacterium]